MEVFLQPLFLWTSDKAVNIFVQFWWKLFASSSTSETMEDEHDVSQHNYEDEMQFNSKDDNDDDLIIQSKCI